MTVNQSKKQDEQYQIPMMVTDEVIRDFGIKPEDVTWRRICNRKCRVVMVDASEEEYIWVIQIRKLTVRSCG